MKSVALLGASLLMLSAGAALAASAGGGAIANNTTTSMGTPKASPGYAAPRSAAIPGLPPQARQAQRRNAAKDQHSGANTKTTSR